VKESGEPVVIGAGKHLRLIRRGRWELVERPGVSGIVCVVPIRDDGIIVLTEQHRPPVEKNVIDLVAGLAGDIAGREHEPLAQAAEREMLEEIGYRATSLVELASGPPSPGLSNEIVTFFLASGVAKVAAGGGEDEHEAITVHEVELAKLDPWLEAQQAAGKLIDLKVYAGLWLAHRLLDHHQRVRVG
jgi:ADP-ribose pyrophosphatase